MEELMFLDYLEMPLQTLRKHPDFDERVLQIVLCMSAMKNHDLLDMMEGLTYMLDELKEKLNG